MTRVAADSRRLADLRRLLSDERRKARRPSRARIRRGTGARVIAGSSRARELDDHAQFDVWSCGWTRASAFISLCPAASDVAKTRCDTLTCQRAADRNCHAASNARRVRPDDSSVIDVIRDAGSTKVADTVVAVEKVRSPYFTFVWIFQQQLRGLWLRSLSDIDIARKRFSPKGRLLVETRS